MENIKSEKQSHVVCMTLFCVNFPIGSFMGRERRERERGLRIIGKNDRSLRLRKLTDLRNPRGTNRG